MDVPAKSKIPVLLLKTKSVPADGYEEYFSTVEDCAFAPVFVPVLEHRFKQDALDTVRSHIKNGDFLSGPNGSLPKYGAMIFTSQRAVEASAKVINDIRGTSAATEIRKLLPDSVPFYVVGPATARGLKTLDISCPILGEETGNGEALAGYILDHYNSLYQGPSNPPILFLVGEKRRDIIPKTLQSESLPYDRRTKIDELIIYETGEMQSFKSDFSVLWKDNVKAGAPHQWVVIFSPTGCKAMLESLDLLDETTGKAKTIADRRSIFVATIGPTTRDYLIAEFHFVPDVCAEKPSPEGIAEGIRLFHQTNGGA